MRSFLRQLFSERDNETADLKRVLWAIGFAWALGMETWTVVWKGAVLRPGHRRARPFGAARRRRRHPGAEPDATRMAMAARGS